MDVVQRLDRFEDHALLADDKSPSASFTVFYRRHVRIVLAFFAYQGVSAVDAADLTAETFAAALLARHRFDGAKGGARTWLLAIARHKLLDSQRRFVREDRARRRLAMEPIELTADDVAAYVARDDGSSAALDVLAELPDAQREAVARRVLSGESYEEIGRSTGIEEVAARKRVSRGLAAMRRALKEQT